MQFSLLYGQQTATWGASPGVAAATMAIFAPSGGGGGGCTAPPGQLLMMGVGNCKGDH